jgi:hypothetical protein
MKTAKNCLNWPLNGDMLFGFFALRNIAIFRFRTFALTE